MKLNIEKKIYEKPSFIVVMLRHKENILLTGSNEDTPPESVPDYDDWLE